MRDPRLDDELRHHIEERVDRLVADGVDATEARRRAEASFGDVDSVRREVARIDNPRQSGPGRAWDRIRRDVAFAVRQLRRNPGYGLVAILTLGLGIGASASIFGLVKAVVLDPLPYPDADRLVLLQEMAPSGVPFSVSDPNFQDFRSRLRTVEALTAIGNAEHATEIDGRPVRVSAVTATGALFDLLGARPVLGRSFTDAESGADARSVVVLSHGFWTERFGADPDVLGSSLTLDGTPYEILGVMPDGWGLGPDGDLWRPLSLTYAAGIRDNHDLTVVGRLAGAVGIAAAEDEARAVAEALAREHPESNRGWDARLTPLKEAILGPARIRAGWVLLGAVGLLVLMAAASVSNLLLARASVRGREMDLRTALGAARGRLVQQLLTESLVLSLSGAALGLVVAVLLMPVLQAASPPDTPRLAEAAVSGGVALFAVGVAMVSAVLFGLAPVVHVVGRRHVPGSTRSVTSTSGAQRLRYGLVAGQVALSLILLTGAGALARSWVGLQAADTGLPVAEGIVVPLTMSGDRYPTMAERGLTRDRIGQALAALPGAVAVGSSNVLPFSGMSTAVDVNAEGRPVTPDEAPSVRWRAVSRDWFAAAGIEPLAGRAFQAADFDMDAEDVVVLTTSLARTLFGGADDALGGRIAMGWNGENYRRVVGVVDDVEDLEMTAGPAPTFFFPEPGALPWVNLLVRFEPGASLPPATAVREAIWSVDPGLPVPTVTPLETLYAESVAETRFNLLVMAAFSAVALVLSLLGIYGLVLFAVERRTREIGVRIALGARPDGVVRMVVAQGVRPAVVGVLLGVAVSVLVAPYLQALLFRIEATDPLHIAAPALLLGVATVVAVWLPAMRATRVEPRDALRAE